jgi:predicted MPP superfamily phosphohydrolase
MARIAPTFAVRGNVDVWYWDEMGLFGGTGVRELEAEAVKLDLQGSEVWVAGVNVGFEPSIDRVLNQVPPEACSIVLYHYPDETARISSHGHDLYLAGHTHGG